MRRLAALLFALVITVAPVVASVCQATCAMHDAVAAVPTHGCHEAPLPEGPSVHAGPHACGHAASLPNAVSPVSMILAMPAVLPVIVSGTDEPGARLQGATDVAHSPPGLFVARTTQIRV